MTRTITRTVALLFATTVLFTVSACDTDEATVEERAADQDEPADLDAPAHAEGHEGRHGKRNPVARLCAELECTDAQTAQITELFAQHRPDRDQREDHREARQEVRSERNAALADAFRAEDFDASAVERLAPESKLGADGSAPDREDRMVALAVGLHAILTPDQRAKLADRITEGGPMLFGPGGKHHGEHGEGKRGEGKRGEGKPKRDPGERIAAHVERFCQPLSCSEAQVGQLTAVLTATHEARREARAEHQADKPGFAPIAALFRAEALDEAALRAALTEARAAGQAHRAERGEHKGELLAEIHAILTPEQRGLVADKIAAEGVRAALGGPDEHGKRKGKGKRGRRGGHRDAD